MTSVVGSFVCVNIGKPNQQFLFNGIKLEGVVSIVVRNEDNIILRVVDASVLPLVELETYGIKVKEIR